MLTFLTFSCSLHYTLLFPIVVYIIPFFSVPFYMGRVRLEFNSQWIGGLRWLAVRRSPRERKPRGSLTTGESFAGLMMQAGGGGGQADVLVRHVRFVLAYASC